MYLNQVAWESQNDLVLEFKNRNEEDPKLNNPEDIKRLNLKYELCKKNDPSRGANAYPILVSVKDFHVIKGAMAFSINLDKIIDPDELQISITKLTIIYNSGKKKAILINKRYWMSDIGRDEDFYTDFYTAHNKEDEDLGESNSITQEEVYKEVETDIKNNQKRERIIYKRNHTQISNSASNSQMTELLKENNQRLENVEKALNNLAQTLKNLGDIKLNHSGSSNSPSLPPPPSPNSSQMKKSKTRSSSKKPIASFPKRKRKNLAPKNSKMAFLGELKEVLNSSKQKSGDFNIRDVLKPMSDDELKKVTLQEEELEKRKLDFMSRNIAKQEQMEQI